MDQQQERKLIAARAEIDQNRAAISKNLDTLIKETRLALTTKDTSDLWANMFITIYKEITSSEAGRSVVASFLVTALIRLAQQNTTND